MTPPTSPSTLLQQIRTNLHDVNVSNHTLQTVLQHVQQLTEAENVMVQRQQVEITRLKEELRREREQRVLCRSHVSRYDAAEKRYDASEGSQDRDEYYDVISSGSFSTATEEDAFERQLSKQGLNDEEVSSTHENNSNEVKGLDSTPSAKQEEIEQLRNQVQQLLKERTSLLQEASQVQTLSQELQNVTSQLNTFQQSVTSLQSQLNTMTSERNVAKQDLEHETLVRKEMEREMSLLYQEKIELESLLEERERGLVATTSCSTTEELDTMCLKEEIRLIKAENESLRLSAKQEAVTIAELEDEIKSIREHQSRANNNNNSHNNTDSNRSTIDDYESRERLGSTGTNSGDGSHECDNVSVLFGRDSIVSKASASSVASNDDSDHKSIRLHAEKLLYWANKAAERSSTNRSPSPSVVDGSSSCYYAKSPAKQQAVPTTIGLPPRSASRNTTKANNGRSLPPRPPSDTGSIGNKSDKENGGSLFNVVKPRPTNDTNTNNHKAVIFNLDKVVTTESRCHCSTSPFSGNDAHSEFYLPKLGLACQCGSQSIIDDRNSFSQHPTALHNILRKWQCDFLSSLGITTAHQLLKSHRAGANDMARKMKRWREEHQLPLARSKECYVALMVWTRTAKVVLRSIEKQKEAGEERIEKPGFLDIAYEDSYTVGSVSTLGLMSSVGGRVHEMMEI